MITINVNDFSITFIKCLKKNNCLVVSTCEAAPCERVEGEREGGTVWLTMRPLCYLRADEGAAVECFERGKRTDERHTSILRPLPTLSASLAIET